MSSMKALVIATPLTRACSFCEVLVQVATIKVTGRLHIHQIVICEEVRASLAREF